MFTIGFVPYALIKERKETVREMLKRLYGDHNVLSYEASRISIYNKVDCTNNQLTMLYSNATHSWTCGQNKKPSATIINPEHVVPQSFFDHQKEPYQSDQHHLFASSAVVNNARGHLPFVELDMNKCYKWCHGLERVKEFPTGADLDRYSCVGEDKASFMPAKQDRGRVARAIFYFYTVYPEITTMSNLSSIDLLKKWNRDFPPDAQELERQERINQTQGNRNPYIDNPSYVDEAW